MSVILYFLFQPSRMTKRRELNKKAIKRHPRQKTPPPLRYNLEEDTASDDYEQYGENYFPTF